MARKLLENPLETVDPSRQIVKCGAAVELTPIVLKEGIILVHPQLPLFRLRLQYDPKNRNIGHYAFELIEPESPAITSFALVVLPNAPAEPEKPKSSIIMPGDAG